MYIVDSKNILTPQNGLNIYRGRTENSIVLTEVAGADPMDIGVKKDAPDQLNQVLKTRRSKGVIIIGNLGDPYNQYEEEYLLTRKCLQVIENNDYGVVISTKQSLIERDLDVLKGIARKTKCAVELTFPTFDEDMLKKLEGEEVISIQERFRLMDVFRENGIEIIAKVYPIIPFVNDEETLDIVQRLSECDILGIDFMEYRLAIKKSVREFFYSEFKNRFPDSYESFIAEYEESGELLPRNYKENLKIITEMCEQKNLLCGKKKLTDWKRKYENKTTGDQMSIFDFG